MIPFLPDREKLIELLKTQNPSDIAKIYNTNTKRISRLMVKLDVPSRSKSASLKIAVASGKLVSPTKNRKRTEKEKKAIAEGIVNYWDSLDDSQRAERSAKGKALWRDKPPQEKADLFAKANKAIRKASKEGSKLELYTFKRLAEKYTVELHRKGLPRGGDELEADLFFPDLNIILELDGKSHSEVIWGEEKFSQVVRADMKKNGVMLSLGFVVIRVNVETHTTSDIVREKLVQQLIPILEEVKNEFPAEGNRFVEITF